MRNGVNTKKVLDKFAKDVIQQSRTRLSKGKNNASKELYNSLSSDVDVSSKGTSFSLSFNMNDYGEFIDKGVSGTEVKYNTPFSYKKTSKVIGFEYKTQTFAKWAKLKGYRGRDKRGRFVTNRQFGFMIAASKKKKGIKPTNFFTKSFEQQFEKLPNELVEAFSLDVEELLKFSLK